jgi:hypothetical protein
MINEVYKVDGKYPDPYEIENKLKQLKESLDSEREYRSAVSELREAGLGTHPLLGQFFVES